MNEFTFLVKQGQPTPMVNGKNLADTMRPIEGQVRNLKLHPSSRQKDMYHWKAEFGYLICKMTHGKEVIVLVMEVIISYIFW